MSDRESVDSVHRDTLWGVFAGAIVWIALASGTLLAGNRELLSRDTGMVSCLVAGAAAWLLVVRYLGIDSLRTSAPYQLPHVFIFGSLAVATGGLACSVLVLQEQRHFLMVPELWLGSLVGFGTGSALLWGGVGEVARRRFDRRTKREQQSRSTVIQSRVARRLAATGRFERYANLAYELMAAAETGADLANLPSQERHQLQMLRRLASEVAQGATRMELAPADHVAEFLQGFLPGPADSSPSAIDDSGDRLISCAVQVLAQAGPPQVGDQPPPDRPTGGGAVTLQGILAARTWMSRMLRSLVGHDSQLGPRHGAAFAVHLVLAGLVAFTVRELPSQGLSTGEALSLMAAPLLLVALVDLWASLRTPATWLALLASLALGAVLVGSVLAWWQDESTRVANVADENTALALVTLCGFAPGWWLGGWVLRRIDPYPPRTTLPRPPRLDALDDAVERWRGALIVAAWRRWLEADAVLWMNGWLGDALSRVAARAQIKQVQEILGRWCELAGNEDASQQARLLKTALAVSTLRGQLRWHTTLQYLNENLGEEHEEAYEKQIEHLLREELSLEPWLERFGLARTQLTEVGPRVFARLGLYPPSTTRTTVERP